MSKKQIYLFCDAGMSTSIMVNKMMEVVEKHQMPLMITAFPIARAQEVVEAEKPVARSDDRAKIFGLVRARIDPFGKSDRRK